VRQRKYRVIGQVELSLTVPEHALAPDPFAKTVWTDELPNSNDGNDRCGDQDRPFHNEKCMVESWKTTRD
jgi:hypothetical protein